GTKNFLSFRPYTAKGVFGHELFWPYDEEAWQAANELMFVVEGELNLLHMQSIQSKIAVAKGRSEPDYLNACAIGGANGADWRTVRAKAQQPILIYDHYEAGEICLEEARQHMSLWAFTTPLPTKDLDEYLRSFDHRYGEAKHAWRALVQGRQFY